MELIATAALLIVLGAWFVVHWDALIGMAFAIALPMIWLNFIRRWRELRG